MKRPSRGLLKEVLWDETEELKEKLLLACSTNGGKGFSNLIKKYKLLFWWMEDETTPREDSLRSGEKQGRRPLNGPRARTIGGDKGCHKRRKYYPPETGTATWARNPFFVKSGKRFSPVLGKV